MGIGLGVPRWLTGNRRARWIVAGVAGAVVLLASATAYALTRTEPVPVGSNPVVRVDRGEVTLAVATTGVLQPAQTRSLGFRAAGKVSEIRVRPGDEVSSGQVLARIDATTAQDRVDSAREALGEAEADLVKAGKSANGQSPSGGEDCGGTGGGSGVGTGGGLAAGAGLVGAGGAGLASAAGAIATIPTATGTATPTSNVTPSPTTSPSVRPSRTTQPDQSSRPGGDTGQNCASRNGQSGSGGTDAVLRAQQKVTAAKLTLAEAEDTLAGTTITAPISGKVLTVAGVVGSTVGSSSAFITLGDVGGMAVSASFPEADAGHLVTGLAATVTLADRPGEEFTARVTQVDPVGTVSGQMVRYGVLVNFDQVPTDVLVGQSANVRVKIKSVSGVLRVPSSAVRTGTDPTSSTDPTTGTVLVRTPGGDEQRQVTVGQRGDQYLEVTFGLSEGDEIVASW
ncbi:efflux RND transporter periplasmic adaptor subunit [Micromonospora sp. NPDC003197]